MKRCFPPKLCFYNSKFMGASGLCSSDGIICIAKDFPLWYILFALVHELTHYVLLFAPEHLNIVATYALEYITITILNQFPHTFKQKLLINVKQVEKFTEWQTTIYHYKTTID